MNELSTFLKQLRKRKNISLKQLAHEINTTDKILSNLENGKLPKNTPEIFNSLANFYKINVIIFYIKSNLISKESLNQFNGLFTNCENLNDTEIEHIQNEINFIANYKKLHKNFD